MTGRRTHEIEFPEIGICGLSCVLCPMYHTEGKSKCNGCKSENRIAVGCPFITCALKKKGIEFCWDCEEKSICDRWKNHREFSKQHDTFKCYQKLEDDISFIQTHGISEFKEAQETREKLLIEMLQDFNEGRSKSYYCIATTVLEIDDLKEAFAKAKKTSEGLEVKDKSKILHSVLDEIAKRKHYHLKLRKQK